MIRLKVLVTGLGLGHDFGVCDACGIDFSWIINNPSIFLWADKIIIPEESFKIQLENPCDKLDTAVNLILNIAKDSNILELVNIKDMYTSQVSDAITKQSEIDTKNILENFPEVSGRTGEQVPGEFFLNEKAYCGPYVASINASLLLGKELNANCLFNEKDYNFLKYKYGTVNNENIYRQRAFDEIFSCYFPNEMLIHNYALIREAKCDTCSKQSNCKDTYLNDIEKNMNRIVNLRNQDELCMAKEELQKISDTISLDDSKSYIDEVKREFDEKQRKINRNIKLIFPQVKRWSNITASISTAISIGGVMLGNLEAAAVSGAISGVSKIVEEGMKYYENKNSWVGFIDKQMQNL